MDVISVRGGINLQGKITVQGSKNATLPVLAATLLTGEVSVIRNCPRISDVYAMLSILRTLGCDVHWQGDGVVVDASKVRCEDIRSEEVKGMRSSVCLLGALLGRCGEVIMEYPGGCVIGARPIDIHKDALKQMGVEFTDMPGHLKAKVNDLHGAEIHLAKPSVGATENVILAGILAEGVTVIQGAAKEPEIVTLCQYLTECGAKIEGAGTSKITVTGGSRLKGTGFRIPGDRIVAGTYMLGCVGVGGSILLEDAPTSEMKAVTDVALQMGAMIYTSQEGLYVQTLGRPKPIPYIKTEVYPGFPTDLQSILLAVETVGDGETILRETIFENRFRVVGELKKMGADIEYLDEQTVLIRGVSELVGKDVFARELRGGAALVLAGLMANGETNIFGCSYIYRGYESICRDFRELGARIISA